MMKVWGNFVKFGNPSSLSSSGDKDKDKTRFTWNNYTEFNQEFAILSLKPHMDKFFLSDR